MGGKGLNLSMLGVWSYLFLQTAIPKQPWRHWMLTAHNIRKNYSGFRHPGCPSNHTTWSAPNEETINRTSIQEHTSISPVSSVNTSTNAPEILETMLLQLSISPPQLYKNNRGAITDLPPRWRRRPNLLSVVFSCCLVIFLMDQTPVASALLIQDTVIFKDNQQVSIVNRHGHW